MNKTDLLLIVVPTGPTHSKLEQASVAIAVVIIWELARHGKQQVLVKGKCYTF